MSPEAARDRLVWITLALARETPWGQSPDWDALKSAVRDLHDASTLAPEAINHARCEKCGELARVDREHECEDHPEKVRRVFYQDLVYQVSNIVDSQLSTPGHRHSSTVDSIVTDLRMLLQQYVDGILVLLTPAPESSARLAVLHAVRDAYGGDPSDPVWDTPEGIAGIIEELSGMMRTEAAKSALEAVRWREALEAAQWSERWTEARSDGTEIKFCRCPICARSPGQGHGPDCVIGATLRDDQYRIAHREAEAQVFGAAHDESCSIWTLARNDWTPQGCDCGASRTEAGL